MDRRLALVLCCAIALSGCGREPASTRAPSAVKSGGEDSIRQITIHTPSGWLLTIEADGAGNVGYGSSGHDFAPFPRATFDFAAVRDSLLAQSLPSGSIQKSFAVAFARAGEISTTARYVADSGTIKALFEKAVASADKTATRVAELYATIPPVPDASGPL